MAQTPPRNHAPRGHHKHYARMPLFNPKRHVIPPSVLTQSKLAPITVVKLVSTGVPKIKVTRPRQDKPIVTKPNSPPKTHINRSPSPKASNFPPKVTAAKAPVELNGGYVAFGSNPKGGKISEKGKIRTGKLNFDDVYFVKELKFNLFSVSQMCDKQNCVLFTDTEYLVLSPEFRLPDENQVLLRVPKENNMYNVDLKKIVLSGDLTCLFAKATIDESNLWHRRLSHINFKTINKLVKGNLVRGLPTKVFENDHTCVACKKGKQHKASCKTKPISFVNQPLYRLYMDLFRPTFAKSLNKKIYCLVVTTNYNRFTWVFFLDTKDETTPILKTFITGLENQLSLKVKVIRSDNRTEFKNNDLNQLCGMKGIKREFSVPRTPQQNGIAERKNRTLIETARTMLADSLLPIPLWAEAVNTACYVQNKVLVIKPQNKTPYKLLHSRTPSIGFMRPFGYLVTILNTLDFLAKFDGKVDEGFFVGYSISSKAFRVFNSKARIVQETLHEPEFEEKKPESEVNVSPSSSAHSKKHDDKTKREAKGKSPVDSNTFSAAGPSNAAASPTQEKSSYVDSSQLPDDPNMPKLEDITYSDDEDDVGAEADFNNLETSITVRPIPTIRVHKDHPVTQIIDDLSSATQTRSMTRVAKDQEPKRVHQALKDPSWIEAMQEELLQFKMQKIWVLVDLPHGKRTIGTIKEEVYVCQPPGFKDPDYPDKVYKVVKTLYGLHQAPRAWYETLANYLLDNGFQKGKIDQTLFIKRQKDGKSASTPIDTEKPLLKDPDGEDVDVHTY
nr:putative ribonuclease H-like domain-containing protein [Tanacetum cinerariifolium]